jgi:hydrogenase expression/formation protein HypC
MCLAVPARILEIRSDSMALVDIQGTQREVSLMVLDGDAAVGDYVLIHVGYAIERIDEEEALRTLELFAELSLPDELSESEAPRADGEEA